MFMDEIIAIEIDKFGNEIKVKFCSHENMPAKVTAFFAKQWAELLEAGFATSNYIPDIKLCRVIYLMHNDDIIGLRIWTWEYNTTNIILTSIVPEFRRRGLLKLITKYYDQRLIHGDCTKSKTFIHVQNTAMIEAAKQAGYEVEFVKMVKHYKT